MAKTPKIRFKNFSDEWVESKLKENCVYKSSNLSNSDIERDGIYDLYDANGIIGKTNKNPQKLDYITIIKDGSGVGRVRLLPKNTAFIGTMGALQSNNCINFIYALLQEMDFSIFINGATIPHIYFSDYGEVLNKTPKSTQEQEKIGAFFSKLDKLISLHQLKFEKLQKIKKSCLQNLFPQNNQNTPKIRFKNFSDEWVENRLGDFFTERVERSDIGELISVTINSGIKKFYELGRHDNSSDDKSNYKKVEVDDIAYNSMRMWQGASGRSPYSGILSPAYTVIIPKEGINSVFFSYVFKLPNMIHKFKIHSQGLTTDTWNLKFPAFAEIEALKPTIAEQRKISEFFSKLDKLILLHQLKFEKLQKIKKSCLQNMFV